MIAAQLAEKLTKTEPVPDAYPADKPEADPDALHDPQVQIDATVAKAQLMEFFDIPGWARTSPEVQQRIGAILEWARSESQTGEMADILRVINDQMTVMGLRFKEERLQKLVQFIRIRQQRRLLEERERALYG